MDTGCLPGGADTDHGFHVRGNESGGVCDNRPRILYRLSKNPGSVDAHSIRGLRFDDACGKYSRHFPG